MLPEAQVGYILDILASFQWQTALVAKPIVFESTASDPTKRRSLQAGQRKKITTINLGQSYHLHLIQNSPKDEIELPCVLFLWEVQAATSEMQF